MDLSELLKKAPYSLSKIEKDKFYTEVLYNLTEHHYKHCSQYRKILDVLSIDPKIKRDKEEIPFVPVRLFKDYELLSIDKRRIYKTMTSSGTSGQGVSKIFLDKGTATVQTKVLAKIVSEFIGPKRLPMLVIDTKSILQNRNHFSARGAGILGFSMMGRDVTYILDDDMRLNMNSLDEFCHKYQGRDILVFGFTYMVWEFFYKPLIKLGKKLSLPNAILIHGGGWKKINDQAVDNETFKRSIEISSGIKKIFNYYGMVEQTGSIFMECEQGYFHTSIFSDVIIRNNDFLTCSINEPGLIQLLSLIPESYPGHSILSEDIGEIIGEDDCKCNRLGKFFKVHGRVLNAEIRGCSDAFA